VKEREGEMTTAWTNKRDSKEIREKTAHKMRVVT
jgi:hypothetical protein